uniref:Uncharacterized protein n=1 Tax=Candidatus Kentrum sp. TC TaxID=2126339 RepID=A0A450Y8N5_9GAMM|nr:MAG: hypothetical protein BECKTC1821E_GA0114239_1001137 [Candidatus Kentron sp. TC]
MTPLDRNEYFEFLDTDDIRVMGTRVGTETVLEDYPNAAITFHLRNQHEIGSTWNDGGEMPRRRGNGNGDILHPPFNVFRI